MNKFLKFLLPLLVIASTLFALLPMTATVLAATEPDVTGQAASNLAVDAMRLNGTVVDAGGENPHVYIVWTQTGPMSNTGTGSIERYGDFDEWVSGWENIEDLGHLGAGAFFADITDLMPGNVYWEVAAINSAGFDFAYTSTPFAFTSTTSAPDVLEESFELTNWNKGITSVEGTLERFGQTWTTTSAYTVASISIKKGSNARGDLTIMLYDVDGAHKPSGAAKATSNTIAMASVTQNGWNRFYFTTPCALSDATEYAFTLMSTNVSGNADSILLQYDTTCYAGGFLWKTHNSGATWSDYAASEGKTETDIEFRIYSTDTRPARVTTSYPSDVSLTETTATIAGAVNVLYSTTCNATFEWGATTAYGTETDIQVLTAAGSLDEGIIGLTAGTEYHFRLKVVDVNGTSYGADVKFLTPDYSEQGEVVYDFGVNAPMSAAVANQRKSFYANGRYWVFFHDEDSQLVFTSSTDGISWEAPTDAGVSFVNYDAQVCVAYSEIEQRVHYVTGRTNEKLGYRSGTPNADGTISWDYAFSECIGTAIATRRYTAPSISLDANGYPWVLVGSCVVGDLATRIFHSSTKNGLWTETPGFPLNPGFGLGTEDAMWQRGIVIPLVNGDMYFVSAKRASSSYWSYDYTALLRGVYVNGTTHVAGSVETCTTTYMDVVGDVADDSYASFSAVSYANDVYLTFCNTNNNIVTTKRTYSTGLWSAETTLASSVYRRTAPVISVNETGTLYVFWIGGVDSDTIYYRSKTLAGAWVAATEWKHENCLNNVSYINTWLDSVEGHVGFLYHTSNSSKLTYRHSSYGKSDFNYLKFALLATGFAIGTRAATDILGDAATLNAELVEDGGETCSIRFQYGLTTSLGTTTGWVGGFTTSDNYSQIVALLTPATTYYFRSQAKQPDGTTVNGALRQFITGTGVPTVDTIAAINVGVVSATVRGYLDYGTGVACTYRFVYGLTGAYGSDTGWSVTTIVSGDSFSALITGLDPDTLYHFQAQCTNIYGAGAGTDLTFTTYASADPPTSLTAIAVSSTSISLSWMKGDGGPQTIVRWKAGGSPVTYGDGVLVYQGFLSSYLWTGLTPGTTYFFSAWGFDETDYYSATYDTALATTPAGPTPGTYPTTPPSFVDPDITGLTDAPGYDVMQYIAAHSGMPIARFFQISFLLVVAGICIACAVMTKSVLATILLTLVLFGAGYAMGILPFALLVVFGGVAGMIAYMRGGSAHA